MIVAPDWMVLTFALIGIGSVAIIVGLVAVVIVGRLFDLHLDMWARCKQNRRAARDRRIVDELENEWSRS